MPCDHCHLPYEINIAHGSDEDFCICLECPGCGCLLSPELDDPAPCEICDCCRACCPRWREPMETYTQAALDAIHAEALAEGYTIYSEDELRNTQ